MRLLLMLQVPPSLDAASLTKTYSSMCATVVGRPNVPQQNQQAVADLYGKGLTAAAELQRQAVKPETLKIRQAAIRELADWLLSKQDACNRSLHSHPGRHHAYHMNQMDQMKSVIQTVQQDSVEKAAHRQGRYVVPKAQGLTPPKDLWRQNHGGFNPQLWE